MGALSLRRRSHFEQSWPDSDRTVLSKLRLCLVALPPPLASYPLPLESFYSNCGLGRRIGSSRREIKKSGTLVKESAPDVWEYRIS